VALTAPAGNAHRRRVTDPARVVAELDATWFGSGLSASVKSYLADMSREYDAPANARLLREGDDVPELSVLISGRVALNQHVAGRGAVTLMTLEPGDVFGQSALVAPYRATSTVVSLEPVHVVAIDAASLRERVHVDCELTAGIYPKIAEALARRLDATRSQLLDLYGSASNEQW
jgi:CRP-like cAMP-binding protein